MGRNTGYGRIELLTLVYALLEQTHSGWENNDGAYGDFAFDVENRTIRLAYNERYVNSANSSHIF